MEMKRGEQPLATRRRVRKVIFISIEWSEFTFVNSLEGNGGKLETV